MKIEKLNDNQIRCTLTHADLHDRQIKLSELICGGEKAKSLFQDMMHQANDEFGFEAEDTPLMIEAIPSSADSIVLIITKVDDPEELDHKFSKFGASLADNTGKKTISLDKLEGAEELLDLLNKVTDAVVESAKQIAEKMKEIDGLMAPLIEQIIANNIEIRHLTALRDTLLPKLMSGEIDVNEVEL